MIITLTQLSIVWFNNEVFYLLTINKIQKPDYILPIITKNYNIPHKEYFLLFLRITIYLKLKILLD